MTRCWERRVSAYHLIVHRPSKLYGIKRVSPDTWWIRTIAGRATSAHHRPDTDRDKSCHKFPSTIPLIRSPPAAWCICARTIAQLKKPRVGQTLFVAVDGHAGSGKTTLGTWLAEKLDAPLIQTDDFKLGIIAPNRAQLIEKVFAPIRDGATTLSYPRSRWWDSIDLEPVRTCPWVRS